MEKYKKMVKDVQPVGEPDQYGNLAFVISFADNTSGFFRCREQNLFQVGAESEFYMGQVKGKSGKEYSKIERVEKHENEFENNEKKSSTSGAGSGQSKEDGKRDFDMLDKLYCLGHAKDIFIAFNGKMPSPTEITTYAETLFSELKEFDKLPSQKEELTGHQEALKTPSEITNELPF